MYGDYNSSSIGSTSIYATRTIENKSDHAWWLQHPIRCSIRFVVDPKYCSKEHHPSYTTYYICYKNDRKKSNNGEYIPPIRFSISFVVDPDTAFQNKSEVLFQRASSVI
jgi:hypothetical protein